MQGIWGVEGYCDIMWATDAVVAQLAEQLIRNEQVAGSIPVNGSTEIYLRF